MLTSEILSYQIYTHVAKNGYSGTVGCLHSYSAINKDVIHRWTYPLVPEVNLLADTSFIYAHQVGVLVTLDLASCSSGKTASSSLLPLAIYACAYL